MKGIRERGSMEEGSPTSSEPDVGEELTQSTAVQFRLPWYSFGQV